MVYKSKVRLAHILAGNMHERAVCKPIRLYDCGLVRRRYSRVTDSLSLRCPRPPHIYALAAGASRPNTASWMCITPLMSRQVAPPGAAAVS